MNNKLKYCYFGNTSVKEANLLFKIEAQLLIFERLFAGASDKEEWKNNSSLQIKFLEALKNNNLINTKDYKTGTKNARTKSAPLEEYGLIKRNEKKITELGYELLDLLKNKKFKEYNNFLQIDLVSLFFLKASFFYIKQDKIEEVFLKYLNVLRAFNGKMTKEDFLLLPLICNFIDENEFIGKLKSGSVFRYVFENNEEYKQKRKLFFNDIKKNDFTNADYFNSSKGKEASKKVIELFKILEQLRLENNPNSEKWGLLTKNKINGETNHFKTLYLKHIIPPNIKKEEQIEKLMSFVNDGTYEDFVNNFFDLIFYSRMKNNLKDYYEQNKYFLELTGVFNFNSNYVELNEVMKIILQHSQYKKILNEISIAKVSINSLDNLFEDDEIKNSLKRIGVFSPIELRNFKRRKDKEKLLRLLSDKFTKEYTYQKLLPLFKERKDNDIQKKVTKNATIPTIFEYIIAICWYYIDNNNINVILNAGLSLDDEMLPKSHATGGQSDLKIDYDDHILMIEVTLTEKTNQRRAEMESVSRHLGNILLNIENKEKRKQSFGVFISTHLDKNVLNDFRLRKNGYWENEIECVKGMNILPLDTDDIGIILRSNIMYKELRTKFYELFDLDENRGSLWYKNYVKDFINNLVVSN